jgi:hypothetical protein
MDDVAERAHLHIVDHDWSGLRQLLHPYLHWTTPDGVTIRGRTKVLAMLTERLNSPGRPASVELRDNQVYRWQE